MDQASRPEKSGKLVLRCGAASGVCGMHFQFEKANAPSSHPWLLWRVVSGDRANDVRAMALESPFIVFH
ncbi:MAG: hypothetical protein M9932_06930 [Xanthobacteraceae bacterium]|nr:hypothetical protein [Xanthobacteraceae bacterium]